MTGHAGVGEAGRRGSDVRSDCWVAEWEHASFGGADERVESDNAFVYRFDGGRIAEMWMYVGAMPEDAARLFG